MGQPLRTMIIFFDYAGTKAGRYKTGMRPRVMFIRKEFISSINQVGYIKTLIHTNSAAIVIPENQMDSLINEILKDKDEFGNLQNYGAYAAKYTNPSLSNLSRSISNRKPEIEINPLDDK